MSDDLEMNELDRNERQLFASLPRELAIDPAVEERVVRALETEGFFAARQLRARWLVRIAAAAALLIGGGLVGGIIGARLATRSSLEGMLARNDLSLADRILLLQRTGSAYVRAAHAYADATAKSDSTAVEVARQVLVGAVHAVVRSRLDAGVASRLTNVLQAPLTRPGGSTQPVIWF